MKLTAKLKKSIQLHAKEIYPEECCGVIINREYHKIDNVVLTKFDSDGNIIQSKLTHFEPDSQQLANLEDIGEIQAYVHSHPNATARASELDLHQIELHQKPWVICAFPDLDFQTYEPFGYKAPLVGRNYQHGWQDCYSLVRDFYDREFNIKMMDFERQDKWWESKDKPALYLDNFNHAGFYEVSEMQYGDVLLCRVGRTEHVNHAVVFLAADAQLKSEKTEACIGSALILHHPYNRKSVREIYGPQWQERIVKIVRHRDVKNN